MDKVSCPTIDHWLYGALRDDLREEKHVDMVFSYYNETTGRVEHKAKCHRIALAAKSWVLQKILCQSGQEDNVTLILVGSAGMTSAEDLVGILYDPGKSGKDITLWDDEALKKRLEHHEEIQIKPEIEDCFEEAEFNNTTHYSDEDNKEEIMDDIDIKSDWQNQDSDYFKDEEEDGEWLSEKPRRKRPAPNPRDPADRNDCVDITLQKTTGDENGFDGPSLEKVASECYQLGHNSLTSEAASSLF